MSDANIRLGELVPDDVAHKDAVHVAVIPVVALRTLKPGERLASGIVDPFLRADVQKGQRYWLWLFPHTVTGMRHAWQHPAFPDDGPDPYEVDPRARDEQIATWLASLSPVQRETVRAAFATTATTAPTEGTANE